MKLFRTLTLGALAMGFALTFASSNASAQRRAYWGGNYGGSSRVVIYSSGYRRPVYGSSFRRVGSDGLTWRQRRRLAFIQYRMMQRNQYRRFANRQNYYGNSYYNSYRRNW